MRWPALVLPLSLFWALPVNAADAKSVLVPEKVAVIVRPMLDLLQESITECGGVGKCINGELYAHDRERGLKFQNALHKLTRQHGGSADEALVVLMCYYIGESQEETDSVIKRGRQMLPYLKKYRDRIPIIPNREYPSSMLNSPANKIENFEGATKAIHNHWKSTADNPEG